MKVEYGKTIDPTKLQTWMIQDLQSYQKNVAMRATKSSRKAKRAPSACYVCQKTLPMKPFIRIFGYDYVKCRFCSHVSAKKCLSQEDLNEFYGDSADYAKTYTNKKQIQYRFEQVAKPKIEFVMKHIQSKAKGSKSWLDVGCGIGDISCAVEQYKGWTSTGIDISKTSIEVGKKVFGGNLQHSLFSNYLQKNPNISFDVISFFGYLGLISNPMGELQEAKSRLKPGGYIVVGEENADSLSTIVQQSYPLFTSRHLIPPNAVHQFSVNSLGKALTLIGCEPIAVWNFGLDFFESLKTICLLDDKFQQTPMYSFFLEHINEFQKVVDSHSKGDYMIMIAKAI